MNLDAFICDEIKHLRAEHLVDRTFQLIFCNRLRRLIANIHTLVIHLCQPNIKQSCCSIHHTFQHKGTDIHLRQLLANERKGTDLTAKLGTLICILGGIMYRILGCTYTSGGQLEATNVQNVKSDQMTFTDFPQQLISRHLYILQNKRTGRGALNAHLFLFRSNTDALHTAFDDKCTEFLAVYLGIYNENVCKSGIRYKLLRSIQHIV
ncbi:hypothetical protein D3C77_443280 [compost metagenome]